MARLWPWLVVLSAFCAQFGWQMTLNPERIAARLRIDAEIEEEYAKRTGRNRRQLGQPKEVVIQVTAPLFSSRLFEYGEEVGDEELPASLDVAKKLQLTRPIVFYGKQYQTVYVLSNGAVAFDTSLKSHQSKILPSNLKLVAPYWNRNDLRNGGHVYFREITSGRVLDRGQSEIRYQYDLNVKPLSCLLITWEKMQPIGVNPLSDDNTNTFQAAIFTTTNGTFANFIYNNIGWTQAAEAGFNGGEGTRHYALPTSGTDKIMYLEEFGNTGIPGEWMFEIGGKRIQRCKLGVKGDTCDETCNPDEWGADCAGCCHCAQGAACHNITGECPAQIGCSDCWTGGNCQISSGQCREDVPRKCALNAISLTEPDRCGDPVQQCQCLEGFEGDGQRMCLDIDECSRPDICHPKATCTNTPGHYFCQCNDGFSGDGVKECREVSTFLYPHKNGQQLPKTKGARLAFRLRNPLMLFGEQRNQLIISNNGLITVDNESGNATPGDRLDDMNLLGIAPFFANIDLSQSGEVTVSESTSSDVLARANQVVNDNLEAGDFTATNVVIVSYMNVSAPNEKSSNTYQTLLIGGKDSHKQPLTFAQFLYEQLIWSQNAEAGIMTHDKSNSIQLPGSGTEGIEQLSELSNVRLPGVWLYRVDRFVVDPCIQPDLQPPYCDAQSPTLVTRLFQQTSTESSRTQESPNSVPHVERGPGKSEQTIKPELSQPQTILPTLIEIPIGAEDLLEDSFSFKNDENEFASTTVLTTTRTAKSSTASRRPTPAFPTVQTQHFTNQRSTTPTKRVESTSHKPIVAFKSTEFNEIPPDAFEITFPPFVTVIPQVFKPDDANTKQSVQKVDQPTTTQSKSSEKVSTSRVNSLHNQDTFSSQEFIPQNFPQPPVDEINDDHRMEASQQTDIPESTTLITTKTEPTQVTTESKPTKSVIRADINTTPTFVFSTAKPMPPKKVLQTKTKLVTGSPQPPPTKTPKNDEDLSMPFDDNRVLDAEMSSNRLAILIPVTIVAVWLLILIVIAVVLCCQRRRTHHSLRTMYGPAYQVRPIATAYTMRDPSAGSMKHYDNGIFDDHIDNSARLNSGDLLAGYNNATGGRMSLYGSYWNLSTMNSARSQHVDHLPHIS